MIYNHLGSSSKTFIIYFETIVNFGWLREVTPQKRWSSGTKMAPQCNSHDSGWENPEVCTKIEASCRGKRWQRWQRKGWERCRISLKKWWLVLSCLIHIIHPLYCMTMYIYIYIYICTCIHYVVFVRVFHYIWCTGSTPSYFSWDVGWFWIQCMFFPFPWRRHLGISRKKKNNCPLKRTEQSCLIRERSPMALIQVSEIKKSTQNNASDLLKTLLGMYFVRESLLFPSRGLWCLLWWIPILQNGNSIQFLEQNHKSIASLWFPINLLHPESITGTLWLFNIAMV